MTKYVCTREVVYWQHAEIEADDMDMAEELAWEYYKWPDINHEENLVSDSIKHIIVAQG